MVGRTGFIGAARGALHQRVAEVDQVAGTGPGLTRRPTFWYGVLWRGLPVARFFQRNDPRFLGILSLFFCGIGTHDGDQKSTLSERC